MSKIAVSGNASGTGTFTIASPATNTDRVLTLPDEAGTVLSSGTPLSSFPSGFANGITMADQWRRTTNVLTSTAVLTANFEQVDTDGFGQLGTGMSESSGIFTFPETGVYLVTADGRFYTNSSEGDIRFVGLSIETTTDGSNFGTASAPLTNTPSIASSERIGSTSASFIFDVTNTSTHKVRFKVENSSECYVQGGTGTNLTYFTFIRLGDT